MCSGEKGSHVSRLFFFCTIRRAPRQAMRDGEQFYNKSQLTKDSAVEVIKKRVVNIISLCSKNQIFPSE